ncbi:MAG: hypothetical protein IT494_01955 [Gammaproteobacteria bacterium]|nr:hypothetical protein [Gammaproteobacteria bacterium]
MTERKIFPLLLLAATLVATNASADFDFSGPPDKDKKDAPRNQTEEISRAVGGVREALGTTDGRRPQATDDDLSNAGASVYGGAEDGDARTTRNPGELDVDSNISIGLPNIGMPSIGLPSGDRPSGGMPGIPNPISMPGGGGMPTGTPGQPGMPSGRPGGTIGDADRALDKSLEGFDGIIMDEQREARAKQQAAGSSEEEATAGRGPTAMADASSESGAAEAGTDVAMRSDQPAMPSSRARSASSKGSAGARDTAGRTDAEQAGSAGGEDGTDPTAASKIPDDIEPVDNTDIVGRQIREAALAESDPALQAKLWEELRRHQARR